LTTSPNPFRPSPVLLFSHFALATPAFPLFLHCLGTSHLRTIYPASLLWNVLCSNIVLSTSVSSLSWLKILFSMRLTLTTLFDICNLYTSTNTLVLLYSLFSCNICHFLSSYITCSVIMLAINICLPSLM
jgi:hypothetical protein